MFSIKLNKYPWLLFSVICSAIVLLVIVIRLATNAWNLSKTSGNIESVLIEEFMLLSLAAALTFVVTLILGLTYLVKRIASQKQRTVELVKRARHKNRLANQRREAHRKATQSLFRSLDHHLRTPISSSIGLLGLLKNTSIDSEQIDLIDKTASANYQALQQIDTLLDMVKNDVLVSDPKPRPINLNALIDDSLREFVVQVSASRITVNIDKTITKSPTMFGDFTKIKLCVMGTIQSVLHVCGESATKIAFSAKQGREDHAELICAITYRDLETSSSGQHRLAEQPSILSSLQFDELTLKQLCDQIRATRKETQQPAGLRLVELCVPLTEHESTERNVLPEPKLLKGKFAVIDDLASSRNLLIDFIKGAGGEVQAFVNGSDFLVALKQGNRFNAVIMDFHMPALSGVETLELINALYHDSRMPIIMMSADPSIQSLSLTKYPMVEQFILKPIYREEIVELLWSVQNKVYLNRAQAGIQVLLIEDDPISAEIMCHMLQSMQFSVLHAANGAEALEATSKRRFDIVLVDIVLPDIDGHTFPLQSIESEASQLQSQSPEYAKAIFIAITAHNASEFADKSDANGIDYHLTKPITAADLERTLSVAINRI